MSETLENIRSVTTPRGRFACRLHPRGEPLVMLHGWPQSSYCWLRVAARINSGHRVILPDLRGLGDSDRTAGIAPYEKIELARDMLSVLDELQIERFNLVGHDWGGAVAQEMALLAPQRIRRLVLANICIINNRHGLAAAQAVLNSRGNRVNWYQHFQQIQGLPEALIPGNERAWLAVFLKHLPAAAIKEYVRCYSSPGTAGAGAGYYRSFPDDLRRWSSYEGVRSPVDALYIYGCKDPVVIPEFLEHAEECFDSLRIERLDAGHFVAEEQPAAVASLIDDFLSAA